MALAVVLTAPLLYVIDIFIINMSIPAIQKSLSASDGETQLVIAGYLLGSAAFLITGGRAGDYLGKKKVFFWGMFWFTLTSCICGMAQTVLQLNTARFFQGVSSAFMVPQSIAFIQVLFPEPDERAKAIGWYGITLSIAAIIGQILGGYLVETHIITEGWRLIFFINLPVGLAALWAINRYLDETEKETGTGFDYSGSVILTSGLGALIYAITEGREQHWPSWSIGLIVSGMLILIFFVRDQKKKQWKKGYPLMDMGLFRNREFNIGLGVVLFHFMLHTAYLLMSAVYLQSGLGISALECGMYFLLHALLFMISSLVASKQLVKYGKKVLLTGLLIIFLSFVLQLLFFTTETSPFVSISLIGLYGLGNGMVLPFLLNIVLNNVPQKHAGVASGIFSTFQQTASALGISIIGGVFYSVIQSKSAQEYTLGITYGLITNIICLGIVSVMLYWLPNRLEKPTGNVKVD
ncbi:MFS transporter [Sinomicrobium weinanense]|uniref:MFS transporter n=1 Tax=Sinomicrobium weinanense TaxID=2842200 RepID=A0A926Q2K8_9FLAO|nr:MFS transporter [Sinomicrobium weinanense]MBC9794770.1 MFS transporter [Sinomicrobium weinanense]MBU3125029.1 MFS transporter [Sinomicrobium weinanense]